MVAKTRTFPQLSDVDLKLLRIFDSIVRNDGFSAAQYDLNMGLPNISSSMTQLEFRLGFKLCERGRSGFHLTEGGIDVHEALEVLFSSIDTFQESVHRFKGDMHGRVAISVDDAIVTNSRCPLHRIIKCYVESAPNLDLNLLIMSPPEMEKALLENQLNIAIGPFRDISDALEATPIYEETQLLCCGKGHASYGLLDQKKIEDAIENSDYAARNYRDKRNNLDNAKFAKIITTSNSEALMALILTGKYVGYLPRHFCESWIDKGVIWPLLPDIYSYTNTIFAVNKKNHNDPRITMFFDALRGQV
jgi:DNA-binding transcriptional LysR family regulator